MSPTKLSTGGPEQGAELGRQIEFDPHGVVRVCKLTNIRESYAHKLR